MSRVAQGIFQLEQYVSSVSARWKCDFSSVRMSSQWKTHLNCLDDADTICRNYFICLYIVTINETRLLFSQQKNNNFALARLVFIAI